MSSNSSALDDSENFRILIATDIHLGYEEKDLTRADDSFNSFEEVLQLAVKHEVDFLLLAGDLFHVNQPSTACLERCMSLLRTYCLGDKPVHMEFVSDQAEIFKHCNNPIVNFEDPNLNISIPVFSIHGNHDDPCGYREISCLDLLSSVGLVNYFGKQTNLQNINISPILLKKGSNKVALYGLSHIRDERLMRLFKDRKVRMYRPEEDTDQWFNIFVCHQNRVKRPGTKHLSEEVIPEFIKLTIWGHEHESLIDPVHSSSGKGFVCQPGSTVATSMCEGEAGSKYVGLLTIKGTAFKIQPLELKTVRLMHFETIHLSELEHDLEISKQVESFIEEKLDQIIVCLQMKHSGHPKQPVLPLIRLRIFYTKDTQFFNTHRFGQRYHDRVANSNDMIVLKMEKKIYEKKKNCIDSETLEEIMENQEMENIEEMINVYFKEKSNDEDMKQLELLSVNGMAEGVSRFVNNQNSESIKTVIDYQMDKVKKYVTNQDDLNENNILNYIDQFRISRSQKVREELQEMQSVLNSEQNLTPSTSRQSIIQNQSSDESVNSDENQQNASSSTRTRGRGARSGRGSRGTRGTTRGRGKG
ncbi:double-strand break repair protein MRE11 [Adelges cooleyi]|uniref:double-strand break repair protein MRE11 n=1 Tax=Adelges cooleyi TaxID=133065 RepID=UPI0021805B83|nr:double-strand break repair protein MRE11 [Adelges cooleyi]